MCEFPGGTKTGPSLISLKQDVIGKMTTAQLAEVFSDNCYVHTSTFYGLVLLNFHYRGAMKIRDEIVRKVRETAQGMHTKSESLLHQEFIVTDKSLSPIGSASLLILQSHLNLSVT